jgi:serine/threonine-protein kinase
MHGPGALLSNRYRLDERVGGGGMGEVWRATDEVLSRTVAVKVMRPELLEEPGFAERFLAEARTMATIKHRGVVAVHDYRGDQAGAFLVMEYVEGEALSRRLHRFGRLDPVRTMALIAQAADALQAAHDRGVVHRDIKPGNLLVTADDTLILTDFGIARSAASTPLTATGAVIGTPSYLAPEQVLGQPASTRSDLYALGVVAYECLSGRRPFDGENPFDVAMKRLREPPPTMAGEAPMAVLVVVERALAADPEQRWQSAAELAAAARRSVTPGTSAATKATNTESAPAATAAAPGFAPARAAVPEPSPASPGLPHRPANPTVIEQPSPAPPATGRPPATPYPTSPYPATPYPASPYPVYQPPARPPRPVVVLLANLLLCLCAACLTVYGVAVGGVIADAARIAESMDPNFAEYRDFWVTTAWLTAGSLVLLALLFGLLAVLNNKGSRGARAWTFVLGFLTLCCCAPGWWVSNLDNVAQQGDTGELLQRLTAEHERFQALTNRSAVTALLALLVALVLLMTPPANRFFRWRRPVPVAAYYPYYPHYPYYPYPRR